MKNILTVVLSFTTIVTAQVTVSISQPVASENVAAIYQAQGTAITSAVGASIKNIYYSIDGASNVPAGSSSNWLFGLYANGMTVGPHTLLVTATDTLGNTGQSNGGTPLTFNVVHSPCQSVAPPYAGGACAGPDSIRGSGFTFIQAATAVSTTANTASNSFPNGYTAGELVFAVGFMQVPSSPHTTLNTGISSSADSIIVVPPVQYTTTATGSNGNPIITLTSTNGLNNTPGQQISGTGIPAGAYIASYGLGGNVTLSQAPTSEFVSGEMVTFGWVFPSPPFIAQLADSPLGGNVEDIYVTAVSGTSPVQTWTAIRGYNRTTPVAHRAGVIVGNWGSGLISVNSRYPFDLSQISNSSGGWTWRFLGNWGSNYLDMNIVQTGIYYAYAPRTTSESDTLRLTAPFLSNGFFALDSSAYTGAGAIEPYIGSQMGWTAPHPLLDAATGDYATEIGDLGIVFFGGASTLPLGGWNERVQDTARPFTMIADTLATSTTLNAHALANNDGYLGVGVSFKPSNATPDPIRPPERRGRVGPGSGGVLPTAEGTGKGP